MILREAPTAPSQLGKGRPQAVAPVPRRDVDRDVAVRVSALEIKLLALAESHAKLVATVDALAKANKD